MAEDKKKFFSKEKEEPLVQEKQEEKIEIKSEPKKEPKKSVNKDEKMVPVKVGQDKNGNPDWKFVPESQLKDYQ